MKIFYGWNHCRPVRITITDEVLLRIEDWKKRLSQIPTAGDEMIECHLKYGVSKWVAGKHGVLSPVKSCEGPAIAIIDIPSENPDDWACELVDVTCDISITKDKSEIIMGDWEGPEAISGYGGSLEACPNVNFDDYLFSFAESASMNKAEKVVLKIFEDKLLLEEHRGYYNEMVAKAKAEHKEAMDRLNESSV